MSNQKSKRPISQGKIIKTKNGYKVNAVAIYVLRAFSIKPHKIMLSNKGSWTRHDCCICGRSFKPYTPQPVIKLEGHFYNICDDCLKANCPELHDELKKRQAEFDKQYEKDNRGPVLRT